MVTAALTLPLVQVLKQSLQVIALLASLTLVQC